jgi:pimeloyl-ACP methyl ester carboxylesterase
MADTNGFRGSFVDTARLRQHVWTSGPRNGRPLLLVHGNITTGGFWKYVAEALPDDIRVIAPDLRAFGRTEPKPIDATRGLRDMADDVHALLQALDLTDGVYAAGWSMGGGVLQQYLLDRPGVLSGLMLIAPVSPYGYGGSRGPDGTSCAPDWAGSGGGTAAPEFVRRLAAKDATSDEPLSSPREVLLTYFGPGPNRANVDEDFLVDELLTTVVGDDHYPGDSTTSDNWPNVAPGTKGVLNTMSGKYFDTSALGRLAGGPPITWLHGSADKVVADGSLFDLATLGELGAVPGWPGSDVAPPQPMKSQLRAVLQRYADAGGSWHEIELDGVGHGVPLEVPDRVAAEIVADLGDA